MKALSTTLKGDLFEKQVFDLLKEILDNEDFFVSGKNSKIFWKKGYYSKDREKDIIVDLSIETYLNNSKNYSLLTIIECKNYDEKVPVDDVEEFDSKLRQIGEHNIKGIMISPASFQSGALKFARNKGIGLARISSKNTLDWVNHRKDRITHEYDTETIDLYLSINNTNDNFFAYANDKTFESLSDLLINLKVIDKYIPQRNHIRIPYKTKEEIEDKIKQITTEELYENDKLNTDNLCKTVSDIFGVKFNFDENLDYHKKSKILGKLSFNPLEIYISKDLKMNIYRWRFTLAHEIGHLLFHYEILKDYLDENTDTENSLSFDNELPTELNKNMEIQANIFASLLLLPSNPLLVDVGKYFLKENIHKPYLYLDSQRVNQSLVYNFLNELKRKYEVSHEAAKYRLITLGLVKEVF